MRVQISNLPGTIIKQQFPNVCQSDSRLPLLVENPKTHCGPVAVSNLIIHLAKTQHQMLVEPMGTLTDEQALSRLIEQLASSSYMNTGSINDSDPGTTPQNLIDGLEKYVVGRGYKLPFVQWSGWGAGEVNNPTEPPSIDLFVEGVFGDKNSIFHLGWYLNPVSGIYERTGGHFANHVGYSNLNSDRDFEVSLHDPSPRSKGETKVCLPQELSLRNLDNKGNHE